MARGGHGLPKVSPGPAMPYPSTPCGWSTTETTSPPWTPHAPRLRVCSGEFHDQGDAKWIVIRGITIRPAGWPPAGHIWWFQSLSISNTIFSHRPPDRGIYPDEEVGDAGADEVMREGRSNSLPASEIPATFM
jgi:hypothetical protein